MNTKCTKLSAVLLFVVAGGLSTVSAQTAQVYEKLGLNPFTIEPSAVLEIQSTTKGFLPPRMDSAARGNISSPANGLVIYNTTTKSLEVNTGDGLTPDWKSTTVSNPTILIKEGAYKLEETDYTVLFNLKGLTKDVTVTLPEITTANSGKMYVINRVDDNSVIKLKFSPELLYSPGTTPVSELNFPKKFTIQANYIAPLTTGGEATKTWNIININ